MGATRIAAVDGLRGLALAGMVLYHTLWDLHAFGLSRVDPSATAILRWSGHGVAAAFLLLSGLSLRLAEPRDRFWHHALARLVVLALAAGAVTFVTWVVLPDAAIRFGMLHCLAVTNTIALLLRRRTNIVLMSVAAICAALPLVWPWPLGSDWAWLGLSAEVLPTLDFRPVLPWLALVLLGLAAGRTRLVPLLERKRLRSRFATATATIGRHSLAVYLGHQPMLLGVIALVALAAGSAPSGTNLSDPGEAAAFIAECTRTCRQSGGEDALCRSTCHCVLTAAVAARSGLFDRFRSPQTALHAATEACRPSP